MLSNALGQTLFSAFDNVLQLLGLEMKDSEGQQVSTSQWFGHTIEDFFESIFGIQNVQNAELAWKKANRIYQAASNIVNTLQSITYSILDALETVGNYVALIGNASKRFGVFAENCFNWMNPNMNFKQNRFMSALQKGQEVADALENVTSEVVNVQQNIKDIKDQSDELKKEFTDKENDKKAAEEQQKNSSKSITIQPSDERKVNS